IQDYDQSMLHLYYDDDGGISGINSVPIFQCGNTIIPTVTIENFGTNILTSATLQYFIDGELPQNFYWEGSLPPFWTDTIVLPEITAPPGNHVLNILVTQANGEYDFNNMNNLSIDFNIEGSS